MRNFVSWFVFSLLCGVLLCAWAAKQENSKRSRPNPVELSATKKKKEREERTATQVEKVQKQVKSLGHLWFRRECSRKNERINFRCGRKHFAGLWKQRVGCCWIEAQWTNETCQESYASNVHEALQDPSETNHTEFVRNFNLRKIQPIGPSLPLKWWGDFGIAGRSSSKASKTAKTFQKKNTFWTKMSITYCWNLLPTIAYREQK